MSACCCRTTPRRWEAPPRERGTQVLDSRRHTTSLLGYLGRRRARLPQSRPGRQVVVASDDVKGREGDPGPYVPNVLGDSAVGLGGDARRLPQRPPGTGEEQRPDPGQAFEWVVPAVVQPVTVRPLVVPRRADERITEKIEVPPNGGEALIVAGRGAALDVPQVRHHPHVRIRVHPRDELRETALRLVAIGNLSDHGEGVAAVPWFVVGRLRLRGRRDEKRADGQGCGEGEGGEGGDVATFHDDLPDGRGRTCPPSRSHVK